MSRSSIFSTMVSIFPWGLGSMPEALEDAERLGDSVGLVKNHFLVKVHKSTTPQCNTMRSDQTSWNGQGEVWNACYTWETKETDCIVAEPISAQYTEHRSQVGRLPLISQ